MAKDLKPPLEPSPQEGTLPARPPRRAAALRALGLGDLASLRAQLAEQARLAAEALVRQQEQAAREQREQQLFALTVGPVLPLRRVAPVLLPRPRPPALPRQRESDEAAALRATLSDEFDVENLLDTDEALSFRRPGIGVPVIRKLRRGGWAIQAQVDLHGLRRDEARERLAAFLRDAGRAGLRCVRVIHGKGNGSPGREPVLKAKVRSWLVQKAEVLAFVQARASEGGHGALVVLLESAPRPQGVAAVQPASKLSDPA